MFHPNVNRAAIVATRLVLFSMVIGAFSSDSRAQQHLTETDLAEASSDCKAKLDRHEKLMARLKSAQFALRDGQLPPFIMAAIRSMPTPVFDIYFITDLDRFAELVATITTELKFPADCDPRFTSHIKSYCLERVRLLALNDAPKLRRLNAFVLGNELPIFINGQDVGLIQHGIEDYSDGNMVPVRILRARLIHEYLHALGEASEERCYAVELDQLITDQCRGLLPGQGAYIHTIKRFRNEQNALERRTPAKISCVNADGDRW